MHENKIQKPLRQTPTDKHAKHMRRKMGRNSSISWKKETWPVTKVTIIMIMIMLHMYLHIMISSGATKIKAVTQMYGNTFFFNEMCSQPQRLHKQQSGI